MLPTASSALNVIVVENHDAFRAATVAALRAMGHAVGGVGRAEALAGGLDSFRTDLLVASSAIRTWSMPPASGSKTRRGSRRSPPPWSFRKIRSERASCPMALPSELPVVPTPGDLAARAERYGDRLP